MRLRPTLLYPATFLLATLTTSAFSNAPAQEIGQNKQAGAAPFTLSVKTRLVVEAVVVKDKQGNFIPGLTAKDFTLTEDGVPQTIRFCEHEDLTHNAKPLPVTPSADEEIKIYKRLTRTAIAPETANPPADNPTDQNNANTSRDERYKNRRLLALYFDMSAMRPADQLRALAAAETFLRTQLTSVDLVSILRYQGGAVDVLQDFTADRNKLLSILATMTVGEGQGSASTVDDASSADTGAAFGQDDSEFNVFNTDRQLSALQTAAHMLGMLNEKKSLIYFASGLRLNGVDNQAQLHATVDAAIKAGVSFWPIDARGLVAEAPLGDATQGSPGNAGIYTGAAAQAVTSDFQQSQDTLYSLAADTGGKALFDSNDLTRGIVQAQQSITDYYILGYYPTNTAPNGHFRKIKVTLNQPPDASLSFRAGYYAEKEFARFTAVDKERQLEDALMLDNPITDLSIAMEIDHFQLNRAEYFVPIVVKIPGRELALAKRAGAEHTLIDFVGEIKDLVGGNTVTNVRDNVNIKLSDATAAELAHRPIQYDAGFTLLPGRYSIKFLARDDETGRIGTYQTNFTVPNLNKEERRVPISSVVLSSQRVDLKDALYDAQKGKLKDQEAAVNPLIQDGKKLVPSVTRVFSTSRELYVYLQAYKPSTPTTPTSSTPATTPASNPAAKPATLQPTSTPTQPTPATPHPFLAFVTLYRNSVKTLETPPVALASSPTSRLGMTPFSFTIPLTNLTPGQYDCQITILDPTTHKATFWESPIQLVP